MKSRTKSFVAEVRGAYPKVGPAVIDFTTDPCKSGELYQINYETERQKREIEGIANKFPLLRGRIRYRNW